MILSTSILEIESFDKNKTHNYIFIHVSFVSDFLFDLVLVYEKTFWKVLIGSICILMKTLICFNTDFDTF